ncbi:MAG: hydrogenase formation protein HypD [Candidatus Omnitrophica bacterium]|nr:hydrogenase formation protein HypD [Candidatus Omnitrophota bacterium]
MKYIDEFRNKNLINRIFAKITKVMPGHNVDIMEVCGTHTQNFFRFGLHKLLPSNLRLISGPGCPVCVSPQEYIDRAIHFAKSKDTIILTFGDMLRVPGSNSTLEKARAEGAHVFMIYSPLDSLKIARQNPQKKVIFLAVGFETTAPTIALSILMAKKEKLKNIFFFSSLKLIPPAMGFLLKDKRLKLSAFLCPGHVSSIIGTKPYEFIPERYKIGCCVTGFEPLDILEGLYLLLRQIVRNSPEVANQYMRVVTKSGNRRAQKIILEVFKLEDASWRGLGKIPKSGLKLRDEFSQFDAEKQFPSSSKLQTPCLSGRQANSKLQKCRCADVLKGLIDPAQCPLFGKACLPEHPYGPCMVSSEGACNAYYKYR